MRVRTLQCLLAILMLVLGSKSPGATKRAAPPTAKELVGIWIGFDSDELTFTRLDLRADSTGFCARVSPADTILHDQGVHLFRIDWWSLKGWDIQFKMSPISNAYKIASIKGRMGLSSMKLTFSGPENGGWKQEALLSPESRIMVSDDETKKSIEKVDSK